MISKMDDVDFGLAPGPLNERVGIKADPTFAAVPRGYCWSKMYYIISLTNNLSSWIIHSVYYKQIFLFFNL